MPKLDARDFIQFSNTQVLNIIYDEFEQIKSTYIRDAYGKLQDIVQDRIRTQANFMISFIEDHLEEELKGSLRRAYTRIEDDLVGITNSTCGQLEDVENLEHLNYLTNKYLDFVLDKDTYKVNIDALADEFPEQLKRYLNSKFDSVMSAQIEDAIGDITYTSRRYLETMIENIYTEIDHLVTRINVRQKDAVNHYVAEYKKSLVNENKFTESYNAYTFNFNGKQIVYRYEGKDFNCYINGEKIVNPNEIMEVNRQLQDAFPQAERVTDAMMRNVSDMIVDNKQRENDIYGMKDSVNVATIPDWMIAAADAVTPKVKEEEMADVTLDDYLKVEEKKEASSELMSQLDMGEVMNPTKLSEDKLHSILSGLDIPEEKEATKKVDEEEVESLKSLLDIEDEEDNKKVEPVPQELLDSLEIKDDEPEMVSPRDKFPNMGALQERLDKLLKTPEVMEYLDIQDQIAAYHEYVDKYGEQEDKKKNEAEEMELFKLI